jgi:molybdopterin molybdotransferase
MTSVQRLPPSLTALDTALASLLVDLDPVAPTGLAVSDALGRIAAEAPLLAAWPPHDIAACDGFAVYAGDLVGASSYSPLPLMKPPAWVEAGDAMPLGCDCVVDEDHVDVSGPIAQVLAEAIPGQGVRRAGGAIAKGEAAIIPGQLLRPFDLMLARTSGCTTLRVRRPHLRLVNVPGGSVSAEMIAESAREAGADVTRIEAASREAGAIAGVLDPSGCDLLLTVGGSGVGRTDATVSALAVYGELIAHGIALQPGRTAAIGRIAKVPIIALPGAPDQAIATWWALALPVLDRLTGRLPRLTMTLPLARKIASSVGIAEIALLARNDNTWLPLAVGELSLQAIAAADAWLVVPGASEGLAAGAVANAYMLRNEP